jgi:hypothetical protein
MKLTHADSSFAFGSFLGKCDDDSEPGNGYDDAVPLR